MPNAASIVGCGGATFAGVRLRRKPGSFRGRRRRSENKPITTRRGIVPDLEPILQSGEIRIVQTVGAASDEQHRARERNHALQKVAALVSDLPIIRLGAEDHAFGLIPVSVKVPGIGARPPLPEGEVETVCKRRPGEGSGPLRRSLPSLSSRGRSPHPVRSADSTSPSGRGARRGLRSGEGFRGWRRSARLRAAAPAWNGFIAATASSSTRLLSGSSAWPRTQCQVTSGAARRVEGAPEFLVLHRLPVGGLPAARFQPAIQRDAAPDILRIGEEVDRARPLQRLERLDRRLQLHAVVGGQRLAAGQLLLARRLTEQSPPSRPAPDCPSRRRPYRSSTCARRRAHATEPVVGGCRHAPMEGELAVVFERILRLARARPAAR